MNKTLLLTDSANYCGSFTSSIRFAKYHVLFDPGPRQYQLFVELTLIDVDDLLASFHQLGYLSYRL